MALVNPALDPALFLPVQGRMRVPVRLFASPDLPPTPAEIAGLQQVAALPGVAQVVALPDLHIKPSLETPSSTATATCDELILSLSSPSAGCGMALALTPLSESDLTPARLDALFARLAQALPIRRETSLPGFEDIRPVLLHGAAAAVERLGLDPALLAATERGGHAGGYASASHSAGPDELLRALPGWFLPLAAREFGSIGRGNHFLELQVVEDLLDPAVAAAWGVQAGQVVAMYHADSGRLGSLAGRLYAFRRKNTARGRLLELRYKTAFHLRQAGSPGEMQARLAAYFLPRRHVALPAGSELARLALLALAAASNYAYANRVAILAALGEALAGVWGPAAGQARLLHDVSHNSIRQEVVRGEPLWVHRHNASQALPAGHPGLAGGPFAATGQPVLLPGLDRTHSYLGVAAAGAADSLYSVDHGAGRSALRLAHATAGRSPEAGRTGQAAVTRLYGYESGLVAERPHLSSAGVDEVLAILQRSDLALPVARLRPLAVLKDTAGSGGAGR